jgi:hypothetical protein
VKSGLFISITFHDLDSLVLGAQIKSGEIYLLPDHRWSDRHHQLAAMQLARETDMVVIWQDIRGIKHFVSPADRATKRLPYNMDPRSVRPRCLQLVVH